MPNNEASCLDAQLSQAPWSLEHVRHCHCDGAGVPSVKEAVIQRLSIHAHQQSKEERPGDAQLYCLDVDGIVEVLGVPVQGFSLETSLRGKGTSRARLGALHLSVRTAAKQDTVTFSTTLMVPTSLSASPSSVSCCMSRHMYTDIEQTTSESRFH